MQKVFYGNQVVMNFHIVTISSKIAVERHLRSRVVSNAQPLLNAQGKIGDFAGIIAQGAIRKVRRIHRRDKDPRNLLPAPHAKGH